MKPKVIFREERELGKHPVSLRLGVECALYVHEEPFVGANGGLRRDLLVSIVGSFCDRNSGALDEEGNVLVTTYRNVQTLSVVNELTAARECVAEADAWFARGEAFMRELSAAERLAAGERP